MKTATRTIFIILITILSAMVVYSIHEMKTGTAISFGFAIVCFLILDWRLWKS